MAAASSTVFELSGRHILGGIWLSLLRITAVQAVHALPPIAGRRTLKSARFTKAVSLIIRSMLEAETEIVASVVVFKFSKPSFQGRQTSAMGKHRARPFLAIATVLIGRGGRSLVTVMQHPII